MKRKAKTKPTNSKKQNQNQNQKKPTSESTSNNPDSSSAQNPNSNSPLAYYLLVVPPGASPPTGATAVPGAPPPAAAAAASEAVRRISGGGREEGGQEGEEQDLNVEADLSVKPRGRKKRFKRHTPHQIQELESFFIKNPHPDDKQREDLSRDLGLEPSQVKFWFQNKRTQLKNQFVWQENTQLRGEIERLKSENEKLKKENKEIKETLASATCPTCGVPPVLGELSSDEQPQTRQVEEQREVVESEARAEEDQFIFAV